MEYTVQKIGNSMMTVLNPTFVKEMKLKRGDMLVQEKKGNSIVLKVKKKKKTTKKFNWVDLPLITIKTEPYDHQKLMDEMKEGIYER